MIMFYNDLDRETFENEKERERDREIVLVNIRFYNFYHGMYHLNHCCVLTSLCNMIVFSTQNLPRNSIDLQFLNKIIINASKLS